MEVFVANFVEMVRLGSLHQDIEELLTRITARLTAQKGSDMHPSLHVLKDQQDQVLSHMSDHSHGITFLTNQLGKEHPLVVKFQLDHDSLAETVNNLLGKVGQVQPAVVPTMSGPVVVSSSPPAQPEEFQLPASQEDYDDVAITTATQWIIRILKDLSSEITEVIETIHDNVAHQRADILVCLPELGKALCGLMEDHSQHVELVRHLAAKLGDHGLVEEVEQEQVQLEEEAYKASELVDMFAMDEDWTYGQDTVDNTAQGYDDSALAATASENSQEGSTGNRDKTSATQSPAFQAGPITPATPGSKTPAHQAGPETPAYQAGTETPAYQAGTETPAYQAGPETPAYQTGTEPPAH